MKKPEKPGIQNISRVLRRWFGKKKQQSFSEPGGNQRWLAKSASVLPAPETLRSDPAARFRKLSSARDIAYTPLVELPVTRMPARKLPPGRSEGLRQQPDQIPFEERRTAPEAEAAQPAAVKPVPGRKPFFQPAKTLPAFWTVASALSLVVNIILIIALVLVGRELFVLKSLVGDKLLGGLYENFIYMDQAHIQTSINVSDTIPISFTLPISQDTVVVLNQDTHISGANVRINTGGIAINSPANIVLPAGTNLPVHLELSVPVTTTVPINIQVPVDIPLQQTELHKPFIGLQQVVAPFYNLLQPQVKGPQDIGLCKPFSLFCSFYFTR
ncbi:MAG TPA: hypothetical protein VGK00_07595 [Anaerolineales bacterium]|jgi:hypothetical protein